MEDREVSDGRGKVCERGTYGYGLVHRHRCEGQEKKKSDGQQKRKKGRKKKQKKTTFPAKRSDKKKMKKVISMVLTGIDPAPLWRQI